MASNDWLIQKIKLKRGEKIDEFDKEFDDYLHEISAYHWENVVNEPSRLNDKKSTLEEETENLTFANYKTFIEVADCSKNILKDFVHVHENVDQLMTALPNLEQKCKIFASQACKINAKRVDNSLALRKHTQLLEILEIPQIMDTCIRAGYYEQALELSNYAARLERRLGQNALIQSIANDVKNQRQLLLENLLDQLTTSINLSTCLKVVSYLKRLDVYTETELQIKFLTLRGEWLENLLASIPNTNSYDHVTKIMELLRNHMFDVISQYRAAFPLDDFSSRSHFMKQESQNANAPLFIAHHLSIFPCWLLSRIDRLAAILDNDLRLLFSPENVDENTDFARLESILNQFMHLGLSLSRIGCDIRYPIVPVFVDFIKKSIKESINFATEKFLTRIVGEFDSKHFAKHSFIKPSTDQAFIAVQHETSTPNIGKNAEKSASIDPPLSLMQSRSLALYCNAILTVFNNFRSCLPLNLSYDVTEVLNSNLNTAYSSINDYEKNIGNENRKRNVENLCALFLLDFVPFLNNCLKSLFPVKQLAAYLGNEIAELEKLEVAINLHVIEQR